MQLNGHKSCAATANLVNKLFGKDEAIALTPEPYLYKSKPADLSPEVQVLHGGGERPRAAIIAFKSVNLWQSHTFSGSDITTAIYKTQEDNIYVSSIYLDILNVVDAMFPLELLSLLKTCKWNSYKLILALDTNSHSTL